MQSFIIELEKCQSLNAAFLPSLLTAVTWLVLRLRAIMAISAVIYGIVR